MEIRAQHWLGWDHMKAAIEGGHDLNDAWIEVIDMAKFSGVSHAISGAINCLQACVFVLELAGLPLEATTTEATEFLQSGRVGRLRAVGAAVVVDDDLRALGVLATAMATCISSRRNRIKFGADRLPFVV
jgi:hypothetical protein